jgi:hypothetical protein
MKKKAFIIGTIVIACMLTVVIVAGCGSSSSKSTSELDGVPVYPGSTKVNPQSLRDQQPGGSSPYRMRGSFPGGSFPGGSRPFPNGTYGSIPRANLQNLAQNMSAYWTPDSFDKVSSWYKDQLKGKTGYREMSGQVRRNLSAPGPAVSAPRAAVEGSIYTFQSGGQTKLVTVAKYNQPGGGTTIRIGGMQGMPSLPSNSQ